MAYRSVSHVALHVASLPEAERYYQELFAMEVVLREEISMLSRDTWSLALEPAGDGTDVTASGPLAHVGLHVDEEEMERLEEEARRLECGVLRLRPDLLIVRDRYGVQWEVATIWPPQGARAPAGRLPSNEPGTSASSREATWRKELKHHINDAGFQRASRSMSQIGG